MSPRDFADKNTHIGMAYERRYGNSSTVHHRNNPKSATHLNGIPFLKDCTTNRTCNHRRGVEKGSRKEVNSQPPCGVIDQENGDKIKTLIQERREKEI